MKCEHCTAEFVLARTGRRARFCSTACQTANYQERNREQIAERRRSWPSASLTKRREYKRANKDHANALRRKRYGEEERNTLRAYRKANPEWWRATCKKNKEKERQKNTCIGCGGPTFTATCQACRGFAQWLAGTAKSVTRALAAEILSVTTKEEREKYLCLKTDAQAQRYRKQLTRRMSSQIFEENEKPLALSPEA